MKKITDYTDFEKLNEQDKISSFLSIRLWYDTHFRYEYVMPTRTGERIISYSSSGLFVDAFMIGHIVEIGGKDSF